MAEEQPKRTTDERIDAIAMNLELLGHQVENLTTTMTKNFQLALDSINGLRVIAAAHEERISDLEAGQE